MVRRPNLFKYLPIRLSVFNCWDAFLQISDICLSKFSWESTVTPKSLTFSSHVFFYFLLNQNINCVFLFLGPMTKGKRRKVEEQRRKLL
jgi:hypothetical protein